MRTEQEIHFEQYLQQPFTSFESFEQEILFPVIGKYEPRKVYVNQEHTIIERGVQEIGITNPIHIYEVIVTDHNIRKSRVLIQQEVRRLLETYAHALVVYHYQGEAISNRLQQGGEYRFSYCYKESTNTDTTPAKRFTYIFGTSQGCKTAAQRLTILANSPKTDEDFRDAFSVEALSDEFFYKYLGFYATFVKYITGKPSTKEVGEHRITKQDFVEVIKKMNSLNLHDPYDQFHDSFEGDEVKVNNYIKKMLGRIVFLYFLQKKGWMCGNTDFMLHTFLTLTSKQDDYLDAVLEPLFFGFLNTKPEQRAANFDAHNQKVEEWNRTQCKHLPRVQWDKELLERFADIPYLNGGLFDPEKIDECKSIFPRAYFEALFEFFAEYNFTIDENDPTDAEIGIDPEMLGKIFENLLEDNKDKGAFYTPKEIVQYMCRESLIAYLDGKTEKRQDGSCDPSSRQADSIRAFVENPSPKTASAFTDVQANTIATALEHVKICDPAIGSGAFPMGLLNILYHCRVAIGDTHSALDIKKSIIENNIYGVDIEQGAIDIARLRFWLALLIDESKPMPLPNLDYKFMQGNSLLESYEGTDLSNLTVLDTEQRGNIQLTMFKDEEDLQKQHLRNKLQEYYSEHDHARKLALRQAINAEVLALLKQILPPNKYAKLLTEQSQDKFFLWHTWFRDVFEQNAGFDIVIGNPPYGAKVSKAEKDAYKKHYTTAQTIKGVQKGSTDTYTVFIEQGYNILTKNGVLAYIVPISLTSSESLTGVHRLLKNNCENISISSYAVRPQPVFENAVVDTSILMFCKTLTPCKQLLSTKMHRKGRGFTLQNLVNSLIFVNVLDCCLYGRIPKIGTQLEKNILHKVLSHKSIETFMQDDGKPIYYRFAGGRYFKVITNYSTGSSAEGNLLLDPTLADSIGCILSSSLSFWFYQIISDNHNWKSYEIQSFTIPPLSVEHIAHLTALYKTYLDDIEQNANVRISSGNSSYNVTTFKEYKIGRSKAIIDAIDDYICPLYGLTSEETNFIKNYEIEFRLSDE